jgi:hypothetical protein
MPHRYFAWIVASVLLAWGSPARAVKGMLQLEIQNLSGKVIKKTYHPVKFTMKEVRRGSHPWIKLGNLTTKGRSPSTMGNADHINALLTDVNRSNLLSITFTDGDRQKAVGIKEGGGTYRGYLLINKNGYLQKIGLKKVKHWDKGPDGKYIGAGYYIRGPILKLQGAPKSFEQEVPGKE